jgi:hypothetical protein
MPNKYVARVAELAVACRLVTVGHGTPERA